MSDESVQIVNKPAFLEVSDGEVLIPISTNIQIELSPEDCYYGASTFE